MCLWVHFKIKFVSISILFFKKEEIGKMSAKGAHVWKVGEGELTNPPMLSSIFSLYIDAEYVFISLNVIITLNITYWMVIILLLLIFFICILLNQISYICDI